MPVLALELAAIAGIRHRLPPCPGRITENQRGGIAVERRAGDDCGCRSAPLKRAPDTGEDAACHLFPHA
jgi:hypothetical protein